MKLRPRVIELRDGEPGTSEISMVHYWPLLQFIIDVST